MWNDRFAGDDYIYGTEPSQFVTRHAGDLRPGMTLLSVADGEGRNSVYLAGKGVRVTAVDGAPNAVEKARKLAAERGVSIAFEVADLFNWNWPEGAYDAVLGVFIQFAPPPMRQALFAGMARALKPGGLLLLHGYAPRQVGYGTGGPGAEANMYTPDLLRAAFQGYDFLTLDDYDKVIHEGRGHSGKSALIDCIARKPL